MASRRTRIKGLANIPQRRKTNAPGSENTHTEKASSETLHKVDKQHNLTLSETTPEEDTPSPCSPSSGEPKAVAIRRKFIKPTVSINAINRKPLAKNEESISAHPPAPDPITNNNKIVILSDIITTPHQDQPIDIRSQIADDKTEQNPQLTATTRLEYPNPPPSPTKLNRLRIKAIPRLGQRHFSESEDENRRNRHRNDSVCSSISGLQDHSSISDCPSPQKPKEFNSVIQRKCRRTDQSRKLAEARRDFYLKFGNKIPDRQKLTMIDLIFYNPATNPMPQETKQQKGNEAEEVNQPEAAVDDPKSGSDEENEIPAPQIKIGPQGEIVIDEQSLVIENKSVKKNREEIAKSQVVNADFETGYGVYKRAKRSKDWSKQETLKFYKALNTIGTDFTLMCDLFPRRSRRELKMKFKKEERINKALIDKAIMQPCAFDFNDFKHEVEMEEKELQEIEKQKEREEKMKKDAKKRKVESTSTSENDLKLDEKPKIKRRKKRNLDIMDVLEDDESGEGSDDDLAEGEHKQQQFLQNMQKPTRSGRIPKILDRYKTSNSGVSRPEPGSLSVVTDKGANGLPIYKVCMVMEDNQQVVVENMTSLGQALEYKENSIKELFTLSATRLDSNGDNMDNISIPEENNITIPADISDADIFNEAISHEITILNNEVEQNN